MKKTISLLLVVVLACVFVGCSTSKYSDTAINSAKKAIEYANDYLNGYTEAEDIEEKLQLIEDDLSKYILENTDLSTTENDKWINGTIDLLKYSIICEDIPLITEHITSLQNMIE